MPTIGSFKADGDRFVGTIRTLVIDASVLLVPAQRSETENAPDYRVHLGGTEDGPEVGAGWIQRKGDGKEWIGLRIDDPGFARPIRAHLFPVDADGTEWRLSWRRAQRRAEGG